MGTGGLWKKGVHCEDLEGSDHRRRLRRRFSLHLRLDWEPAVKLYDAGLCVECDEIVPISAKQCPSCTSAVIVPLSALVTPVTDPDEIDSARLMASKGNA